MGWAKFRGWGGEKERKEMARDGEPKFAVDEKLCTGCGLCAKDCPMHCLAKNAEGKAAMRENKVGNCIKCQHCMAVCPAGAISICGKSPADLPKAEDLKFPGPAEAEAFMRMRRSYRLFKREDTDRDLIDRMMKQLANAPTGCNSRSLRFRVFSMAALDRLRKGVLETIEDHRGSVIPRHVAIPAILWRKKGHDEFFRNAPNLLIVSSDGGGDAPTTPEVDVAAACAYFELIAQANGLATCWCGYLEMIIQATPEIRHLLGISSKAKQCAMLFGPAAVKYRRGVERDSEAVFEYVVQ